MANTKVAVGLLLACAICAHAFPADNVPTSRPTFGLGSSSFEPVKPLGGSGEEPGVFYPQGNPNYPSGTTAGRVVRDDHEGSHAPATVSSNLSTRKIREATTPVPKPNLVGTSEPPRRDVRDATTVKPVVLPGSLASSGSSSAPKNKREEATTVKRVAAASTTVEPHVDKREATTAKVATGAPSVAVKPLAPSTSAPKNKRESSTTIVVPVQPLYNGPSTTEAQSFLSISHKSKRQAPLSLDSDEKDDDSNRQLFHRSTLVPRPTRLPNIFRRSTTPSTGAVTANTTPTTAKATPSTAAPKFRRESSSTTAKPYSGVFSSSSVRPINKRQADDDANRQLLNRPLLNRPQTGPLRPLRRTTTEAAQTTKDTTARLRRDVFGTTESVGPYTVESFSGSQSLPGQATYFTGTNVNGQHPDGQQFAGSSIASTSFGTIPQQTTYNKREADDNDSSSGEDSQEQ